MSFPVASAHRSGEETLIARYFKPLATDPSAFDLADDAAILRAVGEDAVAATDVVVTTDAVVEGVHFLAHDPPDTIARKALRVNLSDLAAKGAAPAGFVLTLALRDAGEVWLEPFALALGEDAKAFGCPPAGKMVRRSGAKPGDRLVVTGTIGDAALGLDILKGGPLATALVDDATGKEMLIARYRVPQPRNALATAVCDHASAAMDVSDGLAGDLAKLCAASGVSAAIDLSSIPVSTTGRKLLASGAVSIEAIISGGDDYEILCAISDDCYERFAHEAMQAGIAVATIGTVIAGTASPRFIDVQGRELSLQRRSYSHF